MKLVGLNATETANVKTSFIRQKIDGVNTRYKRVFNIYGEKKSLAPTSALALLENIRWTVARPLVGTGGGEKVN